MELNKSLARGTCTALVLIAALLGAGCGGSIATTKTYEAPASSDIAFQTVADALCTRINEAISATKPANASVQEIIRHAPRNAALEHEGLNELSKVKPPAHLAHTWGQVIQYRRKLAAELVELINAAKRNDTAAIAALATSKKQVHSSLLTSAERLGLHDCGQLG